MKYLIAMCLCLSGCSLIKINEAPVPAPLKFRPYFLNITEILRDREIQIRVRVSDIQQYWERDGKCIISLPDDQIETTSECNELDDALNR